MHMTKQLLPNSCFLACFEYILNHFGRSIDQKEVVNTYTDVFSSDGGIDNTQIKPFIDFYAGYFLNTEEVEELSSKPGQFLLLGTFWKCNPEDKHCVIIHEVDENSNIYVSDPDSGEARVAINPEEIKFIWRISKRSWLKRLLIHFK